MAVGTHKGLVQVWDVTCSKRVCVLDGHSARVGALAWNADVLSSGSRDRHILQRDVRTPCIVPDRTLIGHRQEVGASRLAFRETRNNLAFFISFGFYKSGSLKYNLRNKCSKNVWMAWLIKLF